MTIAPIGIQRRMMELGVVRFGEKAPTGAPRKLEHFRLTSHDRDRLEAAALEYGGIVREWEGAPNEGTFELYTQTDTLRILIPPVFADADGAPTYPVTQWYEKWSGGGCQRRCDGRTEVISNGPCLCDADNRECEIITRIRFMLPDIPGIGLWRLNTGGYNAAVELPATLEFLAGKAADGEMIDAVLRLEQRSSKKDGTTRRFAVPVIDIPDLKVRDMLPGGRGTAPALTAPPAQVGRARPEIPAGPNPPLRAQPTHEEDIPFGDQAALPDVPGDLERRDPKQGLEHVGEKHEPPSPEEVRGILKPPVEPVGGDTVVMADLDDRRNIHKLRQERGVSEDRLKELLVEITGQDSTAAIPKHLVDVVITALLAEEKA